MNSPPVSVLGLGQTVVGSAGHGGPRSVPPDGVRDQGLSLMSDNGCQPTSIAFMAACGTLGVHQMFTSYNNPKGNADTERFMRTLKEECLWLQEWSCPFQLIQQVGKLDRGVQRALSSLSLGVQDTQAVWRGIPHQPRPSIRGRLTKGEHYSCPPLYW